jgi:hypothetical protein
MPLVSTCEIKAHMEVAPEHYRLVLHAPEIAAQAAPGQFCMVEVQEGLYPFLRRPMCFEQIFKDSVSILYPGAAGQAFSAGQQFQPPYPRGGWYWYRALPRTGGSDYQPARDYTGDHHRGPD